MGKYRRVSAAAQCRFKLFQRIRPVKQLPPGYHGPRAQLAQRSGYRIVFKPADHYLTARLHQRSDRHIQAVGAIGCEYHLLRRAVKHSAGPLSAPQHRFGSSHCRRVSATARIGTVCHCLPDSLPDSRGLVKRGSPAVQIDHSASSSIFPFSLRR